MIYNKRKIVTLEFKIIGNRSIIPENLLNK